jgi:hypothetical protein
MPPEPRAPMLNRNLSNNVSAINVNNPYQRASSNANYGPSRPIQHYRGDHLNGSLRPGTNVSAVPRNDQHRRINSDRMTSSAPMVRDQSQLTHEQSTANAASNGPRATGPVGNHAAYRGNYGLGGGGMYGPSMYGGGGMYGMGMYGMGGMGSPYLAGPLSLIYSLNQFVYLIGHSFDVLGMNTQAIMHLYQQARLAVARLYGILKSSQIRIWLQRKCRRSKLLRMLVILISMGAVHQVIQLLRTLYEHNSVQQRRRIGI